MLSRPFGISLTLLATLVCLVVLNCNCCEAKVSHTETPRKAAPTPPPIRSKSPEKSAGEEETIEDVDEETIDEIVEKNDRNLVVILYDKKTKCPQCEEALSELEEIDDDLEDIGTVEVVKTDDKNVAKELGVQTFPSLVYFRRKNPIFYDGEFADSSVVLRWIRSHEEVATVDLTDDDFEDRTDSASPEENALDWFVMFFNSKNEDCNAHVPVWETVAHRLRGLVHVAKVDLIESDDVALRFKVDSDDECPTYILLRRGKMYVYKDAAQDVKSLTSFALHRYKESRGHRVPEPPTLIEELYEEVKEELAGLLEENNTVKLALVVVVGLTILGTLGFCLNKFIKSRRQKAEAKKDE